MAWQYSLNTNTARKNGIRVKEKNRELVFTFSPLKGVKLK
jgi:hypothetical protein